MLSIRTLAIHTAVVATLVSGGASLAHADISVMSTTIGTSDNGRGDAGRGDNGRGNDGGGHTPDQFQSYREKLCRQGTRCAVRPVSQDAKVCFYTAAYFRGDHFCTTAGTTSPKLAGRWNDRISSIEIVGTANVKLCSDRGLAGECIVIGSSRTSLASLDDMISSFRTTH